MPRGQAAHTLHNRMVSSTPHREAARLTPRLTPRLTAAWLLALASLLPHAAQAQASRPVSPAAAQALAETVALLGRGDAAAALARAERGLESAPGDVALRFQAALALMDLGRNAEALAAFRALNEEHPELADPLNNLALLQARAGQLDEALLSLRGALRNDPTHRTARVNLGRLHLALAQRALEDAAALGPADAALLRLLEGVRRLSAPAR